MEINAPQLENLLHLQEQQAQLPRKSNNQPASGFDSILNQQLDEIDQATEANPAVNNVYSQMLLNSNEVTPAQQAQMALMQTAFDQASGALDLWDTYTRTLGSATNTTALRDAYSLLEGIDGQIAQLRSNQAVGSSEALDSLINELEILSTTEKFKFNRGDYLA